MNFWIKLLASAFFVGYLPFFPGTWASIFVTLLIWFWQPSWWVFLILILLILVVGVKISQWAEQLWEPDSRKIVIDELLGMSISLFLLPRNILFYVLAFILFRVFDILKPFFIRKLEKLPGGWGVMGDDLLAGIYANLVMQILVLIIR